MQSSRIRIESLGVHLPDAALSTKEVLESCSYRLLFPLEGFTGISSRRIADEGEFCFQLAARAMERCFQVSRCERESIDVLISASCARADGAREFAFEPAMAIRLREHFGLSSALAFDVTNACAGVWTAMQIVIAMIQTGAVRRAMIVSGECISQVMRTAQLEIESNLDPRIPCLTVGDAGVALVLERTSEGAAGLSWLDLRTIGEYADYCVAKPTDRPHGGAIMHTDMLKLTSAGVREGTRQAADALKRHGVDFERVDNVILHQTSRMSLLDAVREFNSFYGEGTCPTDKVINNLAERGNTATTSQLVAVWDGIFAGKIHAGDTTLFGISGSGLTIGTALYTFDDLPTRIVAAPEASAALPPPRPSQRPNTPVVHSLGRVARIESLGLAPIDSVRRSSDEMVALAVEDCLRQSRYGRAEIELIIHVGVYRSEFVVEPALGAVIAKMLRPEEHVSFSESGRATFGFDLIDGAAGFLRACQVAASLLACNRIQNAMIVASEFDNNAGTQPSAAPFLETASAVILDGQGGGESGFASIATAYVPGTVDHLVSHCVYDARPTLRISRAPELEDAFLVAAQQAVDAALASEKLTLDQCVAVLSPQVSPTFNTRLRECLGISARQFLDAHYGKESSSSSVPLGFGALRKLIEPNTHGPVLALSVASGVQATCAVYYI